MNRGIATFTLDYGRCPPWLFERMVKLGRIISRAVIENFGAEEFIRRLADPVWFQAFGSLLAFDWNASGLTTTTMGALKVALFQQEQELGVFICGGKGKTSKKTPDQIINWAEKTNLSYNTAQRFSYLSKLTAKVDSALIQDGFQLYHHNFIFTRNGHWTVIQQGMNQSVKRARRYHWNSQLVNNLTLHPHSGINSEVTLPRVLNLVDDRSIANRQGSIELVKEKKELFYEIKRLKNTINDSQYTLLDLSSKDFTHHPVETEKFSFNQNIIDDVSSTHFAKALNNILEKEIETFEDVLMTKDVGPKTVRALSLVSEVIFGSKPSYEDPVRYTYAFGGKDGIPYPVETNIYDKTIEVIERAIKKSSLGYQEKEHALRRNEKAFLNT